MMYYRERENLFMRCGHKSDVGIEWCREIEDAARVGVGYQISGVCIGKQDRQSCKKTVM
jgi:hypothetical protein